MTRGTLALAGILALPLAATSCSDLIDDSVTSAESSALGDSLPGTNGTLFAEARAAFTSTETVQDGLGPIFNERSCGQCHNNSATGGAGQQIERRYGTLNGSGGFDPLAATGGSLRQLFGIGGFTPTPGQNCQSGTDNVNPAGATIFAGRLTTPTFGLGLVELIPDGTIQGIANAQPASIRGTPRFVTISLTSGPFARGQQHIARFGWKAVHASLADFAGDAYLNEMGITTTSCANGQTINDFATETRANRANTNAVINGCPDDQIPGVDDDFAEETGCSGDAANEAQDDVELFAEFMRDLAPAPRGIDNSNGRGLTEFNREGCNGCHVTTTFTVNKNGANRSFQPFSDFLLHDMGRSATTSRNAGDGAVARRQMRTAPLWGLRFRNLKLHDGRTSSIQSAITAHDGQGAAARNANTAATAAQRNDLILFLSSI
jgi:CxxC motif-containing protein (DUF1111 family)